MKKICIVLLSITCFAHATKQTKQVLEKNHPIFINSNNNRKWLSLTGRAILKTPLIINKKYKISIDYCDGGATYASLEIKKRVVKLERNNPAKYWTTEKKTIFSDSPKNLEEALNDTLHEFHTFKNHRQFIQCMAKKLKELRDE